MTSPSSASARETASFGLSTKSVYPAPRRHVAGTFLRCERADVEFFHARFALVQSCLRLPSVAGLFDGALVFGSEARLEMLRTAVHPVEERGNNDDRQNDYRRDHDRKRRAHLLVSSALGWAMRRRALHTERIRFGNGAREAQVPACAFADLRADNHASQEMKTATMAATACFG